jgi:hypothetical protein
MKGLSPRNLKYMRAFAEAWPDSAIVQRTIAQIGFYQAVVDDTLRQPEDQPTIGLLLVSEKNRVLAEYCLSGNKRPVGIAEWTNRLTRTLPDKFRGSLPTIEEIEGELSGVDGESAGAAKMGQRGKRGGR